MVENAFYKNLANNFINRKSKPKSSWFIFIVFLSTASAIWLLFFGNKHIRFDFFPLLYLMPMVAVSGYLSILFLKKFDELHHENCHKDRQILAGLINTHDFYNAHTLVHKSNDRLIQKYSGELRNAIEKIRKGSKPLKILRRETSLDLPVWQSCKAIPTIVGFAFSIIGVVTTMLTLGNANGAQHPSVQDILSGVGTSLMSSIAGTYFSFLIIIYFLILTIMKHRLAETEKNFFNEIGMEADNA